MKTARRKTVADSYMALIREFPLRHISNAAQYAAAGLIIDRLVMMPSLDRGEREYLEVLEDLVESYDDEHSDLSTEFTTPVERLKEIMSQSKMNGNHLAKLVGVTPALVSMILSGKRAISIAQAKKLGEHFRVDWSCFC